MAFSPHTIMDVINLVSNELQIQTNIDDIIARFSINLIGLFQR